MAADPLTTLITERRHAPFAYGTHDCLLWAADCVLARTGMDPAASIRGHYDDAESGYALIGGLTRFWDRYFDRAPVGFMGTGDIAVADLMGLTTLVCDGAYLVGPGPDGLRRLKRSRAEIAWRVACHR